MGIGTKMIVGGFLGTAMGLATLVGTGSALERKARDDPSLDYAMRCAQAGYECCFDRSQREELKPYAIAGAIGSGLTILGLGTGAVGVPVAIGEYIGRRREEEDD